MHLHRKEKFLRDVMTCQRSVALIEGIHQRECVALQSQAMYKIPRTPYAQQAFMPHQDGSYPQNEHYTIVTIILGDCDPSNGFVYMYPGSQNEPLLPFEYQGNFLDPREKLGNSVEVPSRYRKVDLYCRKGDVLVIHGRILHGFYPNTSDKPRPFFAIGYLPKGEDFVAGRTAKREIIPLR